MLIERQRCFKNFVLIYNLYISYLDSGVLTTPKRRFLWFVFACLCLSGSLLIAHQLQEKLPKSCSFSVAIIGVQSRAQFFFFLQRLQLEKKFDKCPLQSLLFVARGFFLCNLGRRSLARNQLNSPLKEPLSYKDRLALEQIQNIGNFTSVSTKGKWVMR